MTDAKLKIDPSVTVHELLEAYPQLADVLIGIAPPFKKLRNPLLRRSVAKIASLKQVASVGKVPLNEMLNTLRKAVGQPEIDESYEDEEYFLAKPDWFSSEKVTVTIEEAKLDDSDRMTLASVMAAAKKAGSGEIVELITTFLPAPGIDIMKSKGYLVWSVKGKATRCEPTSAKAGRAGPALNRLPCNFEDRWPVQWGRQHFSKRRSIWKTTFAFSAS